MLASYVGKIESAGGWLPYSYNGVDVAPPAASLSFVCSRKEMCRGFESHLSEKRAVAVFVVRVVSR